MYKTTYTKQTYVVRDSNGNYLKESSNDPKNPVFIDNETRARHWNLAAQAQSFAATINERYITEGTVDVWGTPKRVRVYKMTVSTVVEPV